MSRAIDKPLRRVFVRDLELKASVGLYEMEKRHLQRIVVSLDLDVVDTYDGVSERLADVLDYAAVVRQVERIVASRHFSLIETLAEEIAGACLADSRVRHAAITIEKPDILRHCRSVGIRIERTSQGATSPST
jgi:dihydroneopterin aldolase